MKAVFLALLLLVGCATASEDAPLTMQPGPNGNVVPVLELNQDCPRSIAPEPNAGCYVPEGIRVIFNPTRDADQRAHEFDHVAGMKHGPWANSCATILAGGYTRWRVGNQICRAVNGAYFQRAP